MSAKKGKNAAPGVVGQNEYDRGYAAGYAAAMNMIRTEIARIRSERGADE